MKETPAAQPFLSKHVLTAHFSRERLPEAPEAREATVFRIAPKAVAPDDANLIVLRVEQGNGAAFTGAPTVSTGDESTTVTLEGRWQFRAGDDPSWRNMPLPARFGASTDILFE